MKWEKPNGIKLETNDEQASIDAAVSLGWTCVDEDVVKPKRKRRTKAQIEADNESK